MTTLLNFIFDWLRRLRPMRKPSLVHVGSYTRELPINLTRMYENAIDGEHLPWLHSSSFSHIEILEQGSWGWRAKANLMPKSCMNSMLLELRLDRDKSVWVTTTLAGLGKGTQISTHALELDDNKIKIVVDFYIPKLPSFLVAMYRKKLIETYTKLYDEDLWMMATRQNELNRIKQGKGLQKSASLELGLLADIEKDLPLDFDFNNHPFRLMKLDDKLLAYSSVCPHMLGPLGDAVMTDESQASATKILNSTADNQVSSTNEQSSAIVSCPWHGYQFDVRSRACVSGAQCNLAPAPIISIDANTGVVSACVQPEG